MKNYELQLTSNSGHLVVGRHACGRSVNVALNIKEHLAYRWGGFINYDMAACEPKTDYVFAACFHGSNAYRQVGDFQWHHVGGGSSSFYLVGLVDVDTVYAIFRDGEPWLVHMRKYDEVELPIKHPQAPKPPCPNNVVRLFG
ncbi:MAG: hypothetical protein ACI88H_000486 [Cocleimonas sp.]|jgi:hypothetical protein